MSGLRSILLTKPMGEGSMAIYGKFLRMYKGKLLKKFYSDGSNIQEFINRISLTEKDEGVQQKDLEDS